MYFGFHGFILLIGCYNFFILFFTQAFFFDGFLYIFLYSWLDLYNLLRGFVKCGQLLRACTGFSQFLLALCLRKLRLSPSRKTLPSCAE